MGGRLLSKILCMFPFSFDLYAKGIFSISQIEKLLVTDQGWNPPPLTPNPWRPPRGTLRKVRQIACCSGWCKDPNCRRSAHSGAQAGELSPDAAPAEQRGSRACSRRGRAPQPRAGAGKRERGPFPVGLGAHPSKLRPPGRPKIEHRRSLELRG